MGVQENIEWLEQLEQVEIESLKQRYEGRVRMPQRLAHTYNSNLLP